MLASKGFRHALCNNLVLAGMSLLAVAIAFLGTHLGAALLQALPRLQICPGMGRELRHADEATCSGIFRYDHIFLHGILLTRNRCQQGHTLLLLRQPLDTLAGLGRKQLPQSLLEASGQGHQLHQGITCCCTHLRVLARCGSEQQRQDQRTAKQARLLQAECREPPAKQFQVCRQALRAQGLVLRRATVHLCCEALLNSFQQGPRDLIQGNPTMEDARAEGLSGSLLWGQSGAGAAAGICLVQEHEQGIVVILALVLPVKQSGKLICTKTICTRIS
mmetsp:Transcript_80495/g.260701  ORF Transcript_80495/g.260701 Transcript_80495/m.260701 type:complete len:276 (-) Transcript_80495:2182-3009(-)